jgi:hypothetical protein
MKAFAHPRLAIAGGFLIVVLETVRRWGAWPFLPFLLDDYIAGAFLVYGGVRSLRDRRRGQRFLAAAWGFASGMAYMSFFGHLAAVLNRATAAPPARVPEATVTAVIGVLFVIAVLALVATLRPLDTSALET